MQRYKFMSKFVTTINVLYAWPYLKTGFNWREEKE